MPFDEDPSNVLVLALSCQRVHIHSPSCLLLLLVKSIEEVGGGEAPCSLSLLMDTASIAKHLDWRPRYVISLALRQHVLLVQEHLGNAAN